MLTMLRGVANQKGKVPRKLNLPMNPLVRLLFCWSVDGSNFWSSGPSVDDFIKKNTKGKLHFHSPIRALVYERYPINVKMVAMFRLGRQGLG